ncbi:cysteine proteinase [Basidiobolus meristosporus CBS 931.73]|uniref:Ubiquitin carboxyl-terminal hydrolase n=1 Tax=Basidiobolus meristosporus CBS 931.73 TaxID=1314790 RepID=A0A1Y1YP39_9FUNG|nr:cysteine proteinase [Basidiobolus meristosporus CBS 931.73]|eukprot:ORX99735.1 cysteine proteinase [Basidiobolus meristosporus CBS 931.73]
MATGDFVDTYGFRRPTQILFRKDKISTQWENILPVGPGFNNLGNTCYMNVALQALIYTPPLTNYLLKNEHSSSCKIMDFCALCELEQLTNRSFSSSKQTDENQAISPKKLVGHLRAIVKHFRIGRQEDAHEFIRHLIDVMQRNCLNGFDSKMDERIKETTLIHQVFGGYFRSQINCSTCDTEVNTFDPFLDLSLEVKSCKSLEKALEMFTKSQELSGDNSYFCDRCDKLSPAAKKMTVYEAPVVLTIQLKRFLFASSTASKLAKPMSYPETLDINPYVSNNSDPIPLYKLYAVIVHTGGSCTTGHYYIMVKTPSGSWYSIDDDKVRQVSQENVLKEKAYMLFYVQSSTKPQKSQVHPTAAKQKRSDITKPDVPIASTSTQINDEVGEVISRQTFKKKLKDRKKIPNQPKAQETVAKPKTQKAVDAKLPSLTEIELPVKSAPSSQRAPAVSTEKPDEATSLKVQLESVKNSATDDGDVTAEVVRKPRVVSEGPVINWDENVDSKRSKLDIVIEKEAAREPKALTELQGNSQFDRQVLSWDDTSDIQSARDDVLSEFKSKHKRPSSYDAEYDRGKVKKVKAKKVQVFSEKNAFQSEQNFRNLTKKMPPSKRSKK